MSEQRGSDLSRREAVGGLLAGAGALSLPASSSRARRWRRRAVARGGDGAVPGSGRAAGSAQNATGPYVGLPVLQRRLRLQDLHLAGSQHAAARGGPKPKGALGDWISPAMVTRAQVDGKDSYVAVVPDRDCVVNRGDHSPRGGTNALTVYTKRKHPLTEPTERLLYPMARDAKGAALKRVSWDDALDRVADAIKRALDTRGPSSIGLWAADHLSPEMNFASTKLFFAAATDRPVRPGARPGSRRGGAGDPQPAEVELRASDHRRALRVGLDAAVRLPRLRAGRHGPAVGLQQLRDRHGALQPDARAQVQEGRDRPAQDGPGAERRGPRRRAPPAQAQHRRRAAQLADERDPARGPARSGVHRRPLRRARASSSCAPPCCRTSTGRRTPRASPAYRPREVVSAARLLGKPKKTSILFEKGVIWSGTQNEAVMSSYANLALLLGSIGRPGRVFGRQGGHQSAYMYDFDWPHPQGGDERRNLWQELEKGTIDCLIFAICNPLRMQQQTTQLRAVHRARRRSSST